MKTLLPVFFAAIFFASCSKRVEEEASLESREKTLSAKPAKDLGDINFTQENLFPEGVVYDRFNNRFYVSSTTRGDIGIVTPNGQYTPFITDPALIGTTGLEINEAKKLLYVSNSTDGSVGIYDINTGSRKAFINLKPLIPGAPVFINDIALDPKGNAYVTNSFYPVIYKIGPDGSASVFYEDPAYATSGFGFNGIEYVNSGFVLVAFSSANQVIKVPLSDPFSSEPVQFDVPLTGPDGLLISENGKDLIVVNNAGGGNGKVIAFTSKNKFESATSTSSFSTGSVFPTTATVVNKEVFVLYAYLNRRGTGQSDYTIKKIPLADKF